ncbi:WG repeat-containing protein [Tenacibaculum finnmarkense]|uniref:WG repeat-containing protein n=1 Tax=Tenacibaculum finnmarkense TaxID=2781243 RepID=UPI001E43E806|nr:WG repeat-containing protein [Tenacibaculum finnmarkense]MCD8411135.1 WG repeat-containing protein [Tenacibaculum finnmarkense genomovar ulcerans]
MKKKLYFLIIILITINLQAQSKKLTEILIPFKVKNKWGFSNYNKKIIINPVYDSVRPLDQYSKHPLLTVFINNETFFLNENDNKNLGDLNRLRICKDGMFGVINSKNEIIIPIDYNYISIIDKNPNYKYSAKKNNQSYILNEKGGITKVNKQNKAWEFWVDEIDTEYYEEIFEEVITKKKAIEFKFRNLFDSISTDTYGKHNEFIKIHKDKKVGAIDIDYLLNDEITEFIKPIYDEIIDFKEVAGKPSYFLVKRKNKITVVDYKGIELMPLKYKSYSKFNFSEVIVKKNNKLGVYNFEKNIEIKPSYSYIKKVLIDSHLFYIVCYKGNYFYINELNDQYYTK